MSYCTEMEKALAEMTFHPEFVNKKFIDDMDIINSVPEIKWSFHERPNGWCRNRMHRKKLIRRFLTHDPTLKIAEMPGTKAKHGIYVSRFDKQPSNPRHHYNINLYEKLYISPRGDIRVCKRRIVHHGGCKCYGLFGNDIPDAKKYTNRCLRSKTIHLDECAPNAHAYYKKEYSRMINNMI